MALWTLQGERKAKSFRALPRKSAKAKSLKIENFVRDVTSHPFALFHPSLSLSLSSPHGVKAFLAFLPFAACLNVDKWGTFRSVIMTTRSLRSFQALRARRATITRRKEKKIEREKHAIVEWKFLFLDIFSGVRDERDGKREGNFSAFRCLASSMLKIPKKRRKTSALLLLVVPALVI